MTHLSCLFSPCLPCVYGCGALLPAPDTPDAQQARTAHDAHCPKRKAYRLIIRTKSLIDADRAIAHKEAQHD